MIKYFASKHIPIISFLWEYSKCEIENIFFGSYFQKKINQGNLSDYGIKEYFKKVKSMSQGKCLTFHCSNKTGLILRHKESGRSQHNTKHVSSSSSSSTVSV
jgi:hypothetical protein